MNYTQNYHLPQWEKSDRVLMDDFNLAMADIDAGLDKTAQDAASGLSSAASCAEAAAKAQSTADSAVAKANAAQSTANNAFSPSYMPFKAGTYTGNGGTTTLTLGFKPSFVIITNQYVGTGSTGGDMKEAALVGAGGNLSALVKFTSTGIDILAPTTNPLLDLNRNGTNYSYIAFR